MSTSKPLADAAKSEARTHLLPFSTATTGIEAPKAIKGELMRANKNFLWELGLYPKINPTFLSTNSAKTTQL
jgi:hypothetical protein